MKCQRSNCNNETSDNAAYKINGISLCCSCLEEIRKIKALKNRHRKK